MGTYIWAETDDWDFNVENIDVLNIRKSEFSFRYEVFALGEERQTNESQELKEQDN